MEGENQERKRKEGWEAIVMVQVRNDGGLDDGVGSGGGVLWICDPFGVEWWIGLEMVEGTGSWTELRKKWLSQVSGWETWWMLVPATDMGETKRRASWRRWTKVISRAGEDFETSTVAKGQQD